MAWNCDSCGREAKYMVTNVDTGQVVTACESHLGSGQSVAPIRVVPDMCEQCGVVTPDVLQESTVTGEGKYLCTPCCMALNAIALQLAPTELRDSVEGMVNMFLEAAAPSKGDSGETETEQSQTPARKAKAKTAKAPAAHEAAGLGNAVAVAEPVKDPNTDQHTGE